MCVCERERERESTLACAVCIYKARTYMHIIYCIFVAPGSKGASNIYMNIMDIYHVFM